MNDEDIKKIIEDTYDDSKEESYIEWVKDFFRNRLPLVTISLFVLFVLFWAAAIHCGILFFKSEDTKYQIMYAVLFIFCTQGIMFTKIVGWQTMHRNRIAREIKRLELRIAELTSFITEKS